ncbi:MAG TPA: hypothetical protein VFU55_09310 [Terracidiphilus sp.]|nr:hypothetical protein [Terracidiphilus sp.]
MAERVHSVVLSGQDVRAVLRRKALVPAMRAALRDHSARLVWHARTARG